MSAPRVRAMSALWTVLRQPFVLPQASFGFHECQWERLDLDVLGCTLCGTIHACADGRCQHTVEVEDGHVCFLSGVVVREKKFVQTEYIAHAALTDCMVTASIFEEENAAEQVLSVVHELLCSTTSKLLFFRNMVHALSKGKQKLRRASNLVEACGELVHACSLVQPLQKFNMAARQALVKGVARDIVYAIRGLVYGFQMPLKDGELRIVTAGMLYLMRKGVVCEGVVILPAVGELVRLLPVENLLSCFFGIKSRTITESENR